MTNEIRGNAPQNINIKLAEENSVTTVNLQNNPDSEQKINQNVDLLQATTAESDFRQAENDLVTGYWQNRLTNEFNQAQSVGGGEILTETPPQTGEEALVQVRQLLQGSISGDVTHSDLQQIQTILSDLSASDVNYVLSNLTDSEMQTLATDLNDPGFFGGPFLGSDFQGFNAAEQTAFFDLLAGKANAENLNRLFDSLGEVDRSSANRLFQSIESSAPDATKVDFVLSNVDRALEDFEFGQDLSRIVESISDPAQIERMVNTAVDGGAFDIMLADAATPNTLAGTDRVYMNYDASLLGAFLGSAAQINNPELKADLFERAAPVLNQLREAAALNDPEMNVFVPGGAGVTSLENGLTALLGSDPSGIVRELEIRDSEAGLTAYLESMISSGRIPEIQNTITTLLTGPEHDQNPALFLDQQRESESAPGTFIYQNARSAGHFLGCLNNAVANITNNRSEEMQRINDIFGGFSGAIGALSPPLVESGLTIITSFQEALNSSSAEALNSRDWETKEFFEHLIVELYGGSYDGPGKTDFNASFAAASL